MSSSVSVSLSPYPRNIRALFDRPPLVHGESHEQYNAMVSELAVAISPRDFLEWLFLKDIADIEWEILRLRRYLSGLLAYQQELELTQLLCKDTVLKDPQLKKPITLKRGPGFGERFSLARRCLEGSAAAKKDVNAVLATKGREFDRESLSNKAFLNAISSLDTINRMIALAEARRDRVIRKIESCRETGLATMLDVTPTKRAITCRPKTKFKTITNQRTHTKKSSKAVSAL